MAKDKERSVNPAQAQRKQEKQKALKKGKSEAQSRRNEKLARRNPDRIQRQIDELKSAEESGRSLRPHDKKVLEALEQDLRAVKKAREALGDRAPTFDKGPGGGGGEQKHHDRDRGPGVLGKRRRDGPSGRRDQRDDSSDTDESVRAIPMPRDTPPPIPRSHRRSGDNARPGEEEKPDNRLPERPNVPAQSKTVYEAAPEIRNLRQEAVNKFVPAAVKNKQAAVTGQGRLVEPEEMDKLEQSGYMKDQQATATSADPKPQEDSVDAAKLAEEEARFNRELHAVQIEEVTDEEI